LDTPANYLNSTARVCFHFSIPRAYLGGGQAEKGEAEHAQAAQRHAVAIEGSYTSLQRQNGEVSLKAPPPLVFHL
jgi:hypothetical protein